MKFWMSRVYITKLYTELVGCARVLYVHYQRPVDTSAGRVIQYGAVGIPYELLIQAIRPCYIQYSDLFKSLRFKEAVRLMRENPTPQ